MLNIETLQNIVELIGSLSFLAIIYFSLNYLMNSHIEDKKLKLYGYNIKSINCPLILMLFEFIVIPPLVFYYFNFISDNKDILNDLTTTYSIFLLILIGVAFLFYNKKQINFLFIILTSILSILSGYLSYYSFNKYGIGICFNIILLYLLIFILLIASYSSLIKNNNNYKYTQEIIFQKELPKNKITGTIIFETSDEIAIEIGSELHRYKKSDIFCIKEYKNPYASILKELNDFSQKIQTDLVKIKDKEIISNCKSIKDNILNLNKMNDNHYDSIINTMKEDILKVNNSLSKIETDKTTEHHKNIKTFLSSINNEIDKIAEKKKEQEKENQKGLSGNKAIASQNKKDILLIFI